MGAFERIEAGQTWRSGPNVAASSTSNSRQAMQRSGLVPALALSTFADGCGLDWDSAKGSAPPVQFSNLPLARAEAPYVSEAVSAAVTAGIVQPCARSDLMCIPPLGSP